MARSMSELPEWLFVHKNMFCLLTFGEIQQLQAPDCMSGWISRTTSLSVQNWSDRCQENVKMSEMIVCLQESVLFAHIWRNTAPTSSWLHVWSNQPNEIAECSKLIWLWQEACQNVWNYWLSTRINFVCSHLEKYSSYELLIACWVETPERNCWVFKTDLIIARSMSKCLKWSVVYKNQFCLLTFGEIQQLQAPDCMLGQNTRTKSLSVKIWSDRCKKHVKMSEMIGCLQESVLFAHIWRKKVATSLWLHVRSKQPNEIAECSNLIWSLQEKSFVLSLSDIVVVIGDTRDDTCHRSSGIAISGEPCPHVASPGCA
jgi:hypothetical protein